MRESCGCGASIHTIRHTQITDWRSNHPCTVRTPKPKPAAAEPDKSGATASTERAYRSREHSAGGRVPIVIGFAPNPPAE